MYLRHLFPSLFHNKDSFQCEVCQLSKHRHVFLPPQIYRASKPFTLIHSDIWGPSRVSTLSHQRWFLSFVDDHTRVCWVFLLRDKSEATLVFKNFHAMVKTQFNENVQIWRTNNGTEFF